MTLLALPMYVPVLICSPFSPYGGGGGGGSGTCDDRSIVSDGLMLSVCRYAHDNNIKLSLDNWHYVQFKRHQTKCDLTNIRNREKYTPSTSTQME